MKTEIKQEPTRFARYTNEDLIRRINQAPDFGWDDEGDELGRRIDFEYQICSWCKFEAKNVIDTDDTNN